MLEKHRFPLAGLTSDGKAVSIHEEAIGTLTQLAGWDRFEPAADAQLRRLSLSLPGDYRQPVRAADRTVWRIAPDRALLRSPDAPALESSDDLVVLDLSDARMALMLDGAGAADLLSRVMTLDFSEPAFPVGSFAQGPLHHVGVLVDRHAADRFELLVPITWARSLIALLADHLH
jgi:heterotetrameric sarcosine oxidase gamma subunit